MISGWSGIAQVTTGMYQTIGLKTDGTIVTAGGIDYSGIAGWKLFCDIDNDGMEDGWEFMYFSDTLRNGTGD